MRKRLNTWWAAGRSFYFLYDPASDALHSCQSLITGPCDVGWWEEKAIAPPVLELKCKGVFDAKVVDPVIGAPGS